MAILTKADRAEIRGIVSQLDEVIGYLELIFTDVDIALQETRRLQRVLAAIGGKR